MNSICLLCEVDTNDVMDCSPPGSSVPGILQARILEWVAMPSSRGSSQPGDWTQVSRIVGRSFTVWATREAHKWCERASVPLVRMGARIKWEERKNLTVVCAQTARKRDMELSWCAVHAGVLGTRPSRSAPSFSTIQNRLIAIFVLLQCLGSICSENKRQTICLE